MANIWSQSCAGSILNSYSILTAAHCVEGGFSFWLFMLEFCRIHAGSTDRGVGGQVLGVANKFDHPNYNPKTYDSDISVLILQGSLVYTPEVQQGDIVAPGVELPDDFPVTQAGWGAIEYLNDPSPVLLEPTAYTISRQLCAERYLTIPNAPTVTDNTICSGLLDVGSRDACNGDSGGPMYLGNIIVGIVSWSYQYADAFYPGVSAAVSPFTNWILETVEGTRRI